MVEALKFIQSKSILIQSSNPLEKKITDVGKHQKRIGLYIASVCHNKIKAHLHLFRVFFKYIYIF